MSRELTNYERATLSIIMQKLSETKEYAGMNKGFSGIQFSRGIYGSIGTNENNCMQIFFDTTIGSDNQININFMKNKVDHTNLENFWKDGVFSINGDSSMVIHAIPIIPEIIKPDKILSDTFDVIAQSILREGRAVTDVKPDGDEIHFKVSGDDRLNYFTFKVANNEFVLVANIKDFVAEPPAADIIGAALSDNIYDFIDVIQYIVMPENQSW